MPAEQPEAATKALTVRRARTSDVPAVRRLLDAYVRGGILLDKATVTLYEDIQEFWVAERDTGQLLRSSAAARCTSCGKTSRKSALSPWTAR